MECDDGEPPAAITEASKPPRKPCENDRTFESKDVSIGCDVVETPSADINVGGSKPPKEPCENGKTCETNNATNKKTLSRVYIFVEARAIHRVSPDGSLIKEEPPPCTIKIDVPVVIDDVNQTILQSGVAVQPGQY